ncbi:MAG: hypothetical protein JWO06_2373 [Bacteroidota bacterium]|nr:hypothetical protein [Bacteroidota bacterium]
MDMNQIASTGGSYHSQNADGSVVTNGAVVVKGALLGYIFFSGRRFLQRAVTTGRVSKLIADNAGVIEDTTVICVITPLNAIDV